MMAKLNKFDEHEITTFTTINIPMDTVRRYANASDHEKEKIVDAIAWEHCKQVELEKEHFRRQLLIDVLTGEYNET